MLAILTPLQIADVGHLLAGYELDDVLFGEQFQGLIDIVGLQTALVGYHTLVNETVIGKQTSVITEKGYNHFLFIRRIASQSVQIITRNDKLHPCLIVLFFQIFDIPSPLKNLQG